MKGVEGSGLDKIGVRLDGVVQWRWRRRWRWRLPARKR